MTLRLSSHSFHEALAVGNRDRVLELLDPEVVIFE
jgi:hypothetical protein